MKKDLIRLLIKECCKGKHCSECGFLHSSFKCYLTDIINILEKNEKENENNERK